MRRSGSCPARLYIADDSLEREAIIRCQRETGHEGRHREEFDRESSGVVTIEWHHDEGEPLDDDDAEEPRQEDAAAAAGRFRPKR